MSHRAAFAELNKLHANMRDALRQSDFKALQKLDMQRTQVISKLAALPNQMPVADDIKCLAQLVDEDRVLQADLSQKMMRLRQDHNLRLKAFEHYR